MQQDRTPEQIAWAAGLFEGEGCWSYYQRQHGAKIQPQVRLGTTDRDVLDRFAAIVGCGTISNARPGTGGHKPMYEWRIYEAEKVREIVALFLPYMGDRRRAKALDLLDRIVDVQPHFGKRTHCPQGHPYEGDNLIIEMRGKQAVRRCKACDNRRSRERQRRNRGITPDRYRV